MTYRLMLLLLVSVFAIYALSLPYPFLSDDVSAILQNPNLHNLSASIASLPLGYFFTCVRYFVGLFSGLNPLGYRLTNILFHLATVYLVYKVFKKKGEGKALVLASIFGFHPLAVESVTWISGGPYTVMGFFSLLSYYWFTTKSPSKSWLAVFAFMAAISSSILAAGIVPILLVRHWVDKSMNHKWKVWVALVVVCLVYGLGYLGLASSRMNSIKRSSGQQVQKDNPLITIPIAITNYYSLYIFPKDLTLYHSELGYTMPKYLAALGFVIGLTLVMIWTWKKDREISFWIFWSIVSLGVSLIPSGMNWIVAERYVYLSMIGIGAAFVFTLEKIILRKVDDELKLLLICIIISLLAARTFVRILDWQSEESLWTATAKTSPSSPNTHLNLGYVFNLKGDYKAAITEIQKSIAINPYNPPTWFHLGESYRLLGNLDKAIETYKICVDLDEEIWQAHRALALVYLTKNDLKNARDHLLRALGLAPEDPGNLQIARLLESKQ